MWCPEAQVSLQCPAGMHHNFRAYTFHDRGSSSAEGSFPSSRIASDDASWRCRFICASTESNCLHHLAGAQPRPERSDAAARHLLDCCCGCKLLTRPLVESVNQEAMLPDIAWRLHHCCRAVLQACISGVFHSNSPDKQRPACNRAPAAAPQVHRLDVDTGGLVVVAKTRLAMQVMSRAFQKRQVRAYDRLRVLIWAENILRALRQVGPGSCLASLSVCQQGLKAMHTHGVGWSVSRRQDDGQPSPVLQHAVARAAGGAQQRPLLTELLPGSLAIA